jgi:hypothetical protein
LLKKLRSSLLLKFTSLVLSAFFLLYIISYAVMNKFMIEHFKPEELGALVAAFNDVWITIGLVFLFVFFAVFLMLHFFIKSVTDEIDDINNYLEEINKKKIMKQSSKLNII